MGAADGSGSTRSVEIVEGWVVIVDPAIKLVLTRTTAGRMLVVESEVLTVPLASVQLGMRLQCIVTTTPPTRMVSAYPLGADAPTVADIIRTLPEPLSDVDTGPVLAPGARPGDVVVPPLPKDNLA